MNRKLAFTCLALSILNTTSLFAQAAQPPSKSVQEDDIREAVLRYQMQNWIRELDKDEANARSESEKQTAQDLNFKIFFISTGKEDPSDDFIHRFQNIPRTVEKSSSAKIADAMRMPVVDKETGKRGIIFSVQSIRWLTKNHVKVDGGYHCDGLCGAGYTFDVRYDKGKWIVQKQRMNWIS